MVSLRPGRVPVAAQALEDLPGSVPELTDERPCPIIHNTQFDQYEDNTAGQTSRLPHTHTHTYNHRGVNCSFYNSLHKINNKTLITSNLMHFNPQTKCKPNTLTLILVLSLLCFESSSSHSACFKAQTADNLSVSYHTNVSL